MKLIRYFAVFGVAIFFIGCAVSQRPPLYHDASNPLKRVAVLPMRNDTNDVDGPNVVRKRVVQAMQDRAYAVQDVKVTDRILRDRMGITLGGQLDLTTARELGETLGVEGVLYGTLMDFDELTTGAYNVRKVRAQFRLVNTMTGETVWQRGLGVRSEIIMGGQAGVAAAIAGRAIDARDKDVPWITIQTITTGDKNYADNLAIGLGTRLLTQAVGIHLNYESAELARRVTTDLRWGPGLAVAAMPPPSFTNSEMRIPDHPFFRYVDWEGKRSFSAIVHSITFDKNRNNTDTAVMPLWIADQKYRLEMDASKVMKINMRDPARKLVMIERSDMNVDYVLYPAAQRYVVHYKKEDLESKPEIEKTKMGSEMIGLHPTEKFRIKISYKDGRVEEGFVWNASDLNGLTIKSEVESGDSQTAIELKDILLQTPRAALFEIPAGYTEVENIRDLLAADLKKNETGGRFPTSGGK